MCCRAKATPALPQAESLGAIPALQKYYDAKVYPTEKRHLYSEFYTPGFTQAELEGKPIIMLLGQYSVGKTSMIEYLLNGKYPGADIGPEPTTDIFAHISYNENPTQIDGPTLAQDQTYSLKGLEMFGEKFLNKLRATNFNAELLQHLSILDTPGILAGQKQTDARGYDYAAVISYLAERVDKIILMFDANKVDLSDEYKDVIKSLDGHSEKVRIVLNKCDAISPRELIQVRGALMWSLGKIFTTPEVPKVFIGSFWKYISKENTMSKTMREDTDALIKEFCDLANSCKGRRINDVVKRAKCVRTHAYLMDEIMRGSMYFNMKSAMNRKNLTKKFLFVQKKYRIVPCDMPKEADFLERAQKTNGKEWKKIDKNEMKLLDSFLNQDITKIIAIASAEPHTQITFNVMEKVEKPPEDKVEFKMLPSKREKKEGKTNKEDEELKSMSKKKDEEKEKIKQADDGNDKKKDGERKKEDEPKKKDKKKEAEKKEKSKMEGEGDDIKKEEVEREKEKSKKVESKVEKKKADALDDKKQDEGKEKDKEAEPEMKNKSKKVEVKKSKKENKDVKKEDDKMEEKENTKKEDLQEDPTQLKKPDEDIQEV